MTGKSKQELLKVDGEVWKDFVQYCNESGVDANNLLENLMKQEIETRKEEGS